MQKRKGTPKPQGVKIIQIATSSDGRVIAVGDNGKAYWYWSTHDARTGMIVDHGWCEYPILPENAPTNRGEKPLTENHE